MYLLDWRVVSNRARLICWTHVRERFISSRNSIAQSLDRYYQRKNSASINFVENYSDQMPALLHLTSVGWVGEVAALRIFRVLLSGRFLPVSCQSHQQLNRRRPPRGLTGRSQV